MKTYSIRSEDGMLIAKLSRRAALSILQRATGSWREVKTVKKTIRCFEIDGDGVSWCLGKGHFEVEIFLWAGTLIIED